MIKIIEPRFTEEDAKVLSEIVLSGYITRGPWTKKFSEAFAQFLGVEKVYTVCSGTAALYVILKALNVEGKHVVVPALSFMATIDTVILAGGIPVVVDVDDYYTMDVNQLEDAIKKYNPVCIIPVHLYGGMADMDSIMSLANKYNIYVLEDAAQAHGASFKGKMAGAIGHVGAFSFYASKNVPMGEGGAISSSDESILKAVNALIDFGDSPALNLRITEFQAALGFLGLQRLKEQNDKRIKNAEYYNKHLSDELIKPKQRENSHHVYHLYTLRHKNRDHIIESLKKEDIDARVYYTYTLASLRDALHLPLDNANKYIKELFSIPVHPYLSQEDLEKIVYVINKSL
ncbi:MAG: DegT/DnrJ/EryC1/StrS aminotransferase family protein [Hydrogenobaculum sp.]